MEEFFVEKAREEAGRSDIEQFNSSPVMPIHLMERFETWKGWAESEFCRPCQSRGRVRLSTLKILNLGYRNAQGHTNSLRGCNREDTDLIISLILRGHSPIICSSCQL
jgi:hypothetical protein